MFILASKSPRRKEILHQLVDDFLIIPSNIDEDKIISDPYSLSEKISKEKALEIYKDHKDDTILACDTIVILDNEVLGKPKDKEDAIKMLKNLSGREHTVISGYTFINNGKTISRSVVSYVVFNKLDDDLIKRYVDTGSPLDKAGAYGVQDKEFNIIKEIRGSYYNVMGLPLEDIKEYCFKN